MELLSNISNIYLRSLLSQKYNGETTGVIRLATGEDCFLNYDCRLDNIVFHVDNERTLLTIKQSVIKPLLFDFKTLTMNGNTSHHITLNSYIFILK